MACDRAAAAAARPDAGWFAPGTTPGTAAADVAGAAVPVDGFGEEFGEVLVGAASAFVVWLACIRLLRLRL